jgi:hypothetical protein
MKSLELLSKKIEVTEAVCSHPFIKEAIMHRVLMNQINNYDMVLIVGGLEANIGAVVRVHGIISADQPGIPTRRLIDDMWCMNDTNEPLYVCRGEGLYSRLRCKNTGEMYTRPSKIALYLARQLMPLTGEFSNSLQGDIKDGK